MISFPSSYRALGLLTYNLKRLSRFICAEYPDRRGQVLSVFSLTLRFWSDCSGQLVPWQFIGPPTSLLTTKSFTRLMTLAIVASVPPSSFSGWAKSIGLPPLSNPRARRILLMYVDAACKLCCSITPKKNMSAKSEAIWASNCRPLGWLYCMYVCNKFGFPNRKKVNTAGYGNRKKPEVQSVARYLHVLSLILFTAQQHFLSLSPPFFSLSTGTAFTTLINSDNVSPFYFRPSLGQLQLQLTYCRAHGMVNMCNGTEYSYALMSSQVKSSEPL